MVLSAGFSMWLSSAMTPLDFMVLVSRNSRREQVAVVAAAFHFGPANTLPKPPPVALIVVIELEIRKAATPAPPIAISSCGSGLEDHGHVAAGDDEAAEHHARTAATMPMI